MDKLLEEEIIAHINCASDDLRLAVKKLRSPAVEANDKTMRLESHLTRALEIITGGKL